MSRVLVVSHEATLTGAPRVAALVMSCLRERGHHVTAVSRWPGPLLEELRAAAPTSVERGWRLRRRLWAWGGAAQRLGVLLDLVVATWVLLRAGRGIVYINSTAAAAYLRPARWLRRPVVLHVHESQDVIAGFLRAYGIRDPAGLSAAALTWVACSPSVERDLLQLGVPSRSVHLVVSVPDEAPVAAQRPVGRRTPSAGGADAVMVGACGAVEHRKGVDLWLQVAGAVGQDGGQDAGQDGPGVEFVWVGGGEPPPGAAGMPHVDFVGETRTPLAHIAQFDVMTLPSRDDPFPLVVIEAMRLGKPVVAFAVGGVGEQLGDAGVLVPPGDVDGFVRAVRTLVADPELRRDLGARARHRADTLFSREAFAQKLERVMEMTARPLSQEELCT